MVLTTARANKLLLQPFLVLRCSTGAAESKREREMPHSFILHSPESVGSALIDQKAIVILYVYFGEWNNGPLGAHALPYEVLLSL